MLLDGCCRHEGGGRVEETTMAIRRDCGRAILLILFSYYFYTFSTLSTTAITSVGNILHEKDIDDVLLLDNSIDVVVRGT